MTQRITFDDSRARTYRKRTEVLAFKSEDPFQFDKSWGTQSIRKGGWVIVPVSEDGSVASDIYGCDADVFEETYEPSPSLRPNRYRKKETIRAYQPGHPFEIDTVLDDGHVEVESSRSLSQDGWIVRAPGGEIYLIENETFEKTYTEVDPKGE